MAKQTINIGSSPNDGSGDTIRDAFDKTNDNFNELYFNLVTPYRLESGGTNVEIGSANANVTIDVNNSANVATFSTDGVVLTGNLSTKHITANSLTVTDDITGAGRIDITGEAVFGNISGAELTVSENAVVTGNITANANITAGGFIIGDGGFLSNVTVVSNVAVSQLANGTSVISIATVNGNIVNTAAGNLVLELSGDGANITGYADITGAITTASDITATGNITGAYILGNGSQLSGIPAGYTDSDVVTLVGAFGSNAISTTGNITAGNIIASTAIEGTLSTATQTSITSVGTLTGLTMGANIAMGTNNITGLADPVLAQDAATKTYVDTIAAAGLHYHDPVRVEAEVALSADYDNGTAGVGATLTNNSTQAALVIDGVTLSTSDRVLIYQQTNAAHNGVYTVTDTGSVSTNWVLTRATDADSYGASDKDALGEGDAFFVQEGSAGAGELYVMNTTGTITFGTTNIAFAQISSAQIYSATNGVDLSGVVFSLDSTYSPTFAGLTVPSITHSGSDGVGNIGASGQGFNTVFAKATSAQYADLAEKYIADAQYAPGTVVVFGGEKEVTQSNIDADPAVAGVVSTSPAYLMNDGLVSEFVVTVALVGRVPCAVVGPVKKGQMLVNCGGGLARAEENPAMGTVIGKALTDTIPEAGPGLVSVIEVVVGRL